MSIKNKGFVLLETIIVMSILLIGMILLYSNYNRIFMNSGKISYYDNVEDMYTAYYVYLNKDTINTNSNEVVDVSNNEVLNNLGIERIYFIDKDVFQNLYTKKATSCETLDSLDCFDGTTIAYLKSIENKSNVDKCAENNDCLTIVKIKRGNHYYFAKFEAYNIKPASNVNTLWEFQYTGGEQTFTAPITGTYKIETWGAQGGNTNNYDGGYGGYSTGYIYIKTNSTLYINIGGKGNSTPAGVIQYVAGGYNGGGSTSGQDCCNRYYGSGGGATHIATKSGLLSTLENNKDSILIVSGGGGGAYYGENDGTEGLSGGAGGGIIGMSGTESTIKNNQWCVGLGGTQTLGGAITTNCNYSSNVGGSTITGTFGNGGSGTTSTGGGGGYYGGSRSGHIAPAGGGSGYIGSSKLFDKSMYCYNCTESSDVSTKTISTSCHSATPTTNCAKEGNGYARITYMGK